MTEELLLLSGGIDSIALAHLRRPVAALTINYGQNPAEKEIAVAKYIAGRLGIEHHQAELDLSSFGTGAMAGRDASIEAPNAEWWAFRNQLLVTVGAMLAIRLGLPVVTIGTVSSDQVYADGSPAFLSLVDQLIRIQEGGIRLAAPASHLSSLQLVRESQIPPNLLAAAHCCHRFNIPCERCRGCQKHERVFTELGLVQTATTERGHG
jgi:7-cyano-7-deazaguanine synthase